MTDQLPQGTSLMEAEGQLTVKYGGKTAVNLKKAASSTPDVNEYTYDETTREFKVTLDPKFNSDFVYVNYKIWLDTQAAVKQGSVRNTAVMTVGNHVSISDYEDSSWGIGYQEGKLGLSKSGAFARVGDDNTIKWTVTVNNNPTKTVNGDIQFKDVLPEGHRLVEGSLKYGKTVLGTEKSAEQPYYEVSGNNIIIYFPEQMLPTDQNDLTLSTVTDETKVETKPEKVSAVNEVSVRADEFKTELTAKAAVNVNYTPDVEKTTSYKKGNYVDWTVNVNKNHAVITKQKAEITDQLQSGLTYREGSVKLIDVTANNKLISGMETDYDDVSGKIVFTFPDGLDLTHQFEVVFITDVTSATGNIKNTVTFDASAKETKATSGSVPLILSGMNSGLTGDNIRFILNKTDAEDNAPLENVEFQLYDHNRNEVGSVLKTDKKGRIAFDAGLKYGNTYYR